MNPVVTLGVFDGVHRGTGLFLTGLFHWQRKQEENLLLLLFLPIHGIVLEKDNLNLSFLTTMSEKQALLENSGIDHLIILEFNREFSNIKACDFVSEILIKKIGTKHLIIGYDHHFGRSGEGDLDTIKECTELSDLSVEQIKGVTIDGKTGKLFRNKGSYY